MDRPHQGPVVDNDEQQRQQHYLLAPLSTVERPRAYVEEDHQRSSASGFEEMAPSHIQNSSYEYPSPTLQPAVLSPYRPNTPCPPFHQAPFPDQPFLYGPSAPYGPDIQQPFQQTGPFQFPFHQAPAPQQLFLHGPFSAYGSDLQYPFPQIGHVQFPSYQAAQAPPPFLQTTPIPANPDQFRNYVTPAAQETFPAPKGFTRAGYARERHMRNTGQFKCGICGVGLTRLASMYEPHFLRCLKKNRGSRYARWDDHPSCWLNGGQGTAVPRGYKTVMQSMGVVPYDWQENPEGRDTNITHDKGPGGKVGKPMRRKKDDNDEQGKPPTLAAIQQATTPATHPRHQLLTGQRDFQPTVQVVDWLAGLESRSATVRLGGPLSRAGDVEEAGVVERAGVADHAGDIDHEGDTVMAEDGSTVVGEASSQRMVAHTPAATGESLPHNPVVVGSELGALRLQQEGHKREALVHETEPHQHRREAQLLQESIDEVAALTDDESSLSSAESEPTRKFIGSQC